jgi:hypothetical protein
MAHYANPARPQRQSQTYATPSGQPIIINNNVAASAAATAQVSGPRVHYCRRSQSAALHVALFLTTAGLGNIFYIAYKSSRYCPHH